MKLKNKIIIRICAGCILPRKAKLIGTGEYPLIKNGYKIKERYYDYEIKEKYMESFLEQNYDILVNYKLIDEKPKPINPKDKNPVKDTTLRGWTKVADSQTKN